MPDLTPEKLAELRRLLDAATPVPWAQGDPAFGGRNAQCVVSISSEAMGRDVMGPMLRPALFDVELIVAAVNALPALLDAAAERDRLAAAWDEGHQAGHEDARAVQSTYPEPTPNPYRAEGDPR